MLFKNSVRTSKINWLMLFQEIIAVYSENHAKPINTKCSITDCQSRWFISLSLGLKGLIYRYVKYGSSEALVTTSNTSWRHNPADNNPYFHRRENLQITSSQFAVCEIIIPSCA
jgi:hypothetical protein